MKKKPPLLSLIIPVKDEMENIPTLEEEIKQTLETTELTWECIWIDDGSEDNTLEVLKTMNRKDGRNRYISFDKNYGNMAAMLTGFRHGKGEIFVTMDGDGQNDPADIPPLVRRVLDDEADLINGVRTLRMDSWIRKISSAIGNGFRNWLTRENITDVGCQLRVFRRACVAEFPPFDGLHRFFPTLVRIQGWRIVESPVNHRPRLHGKPKYGIRNRMWRGLLDTFAVRWMQKRLIRYQIKTRENPQTERHTI
jgi:dolichol-phosphate mannosyltransferase